MASTISTTLPDQLARTQRFSVGVPNAFTVTPDESAVLFLRARSTDRPAPGLWCLDLAAGTERLLAEEVAAYTVSEGLAAFARGGGVWTVSIADGTLRRLTTAGASGEVRFDPSGQRLAYRADGALRVIGVDGSGDRALAQPDGPEVEFGTGPYLHTTSPDGGYWWAPDGQRLLVARVDEAQVQLWQVADSSEPTAPSRSYRYPAVGTPNPETTLWLIDLDGRRVPVDRDGETFEYLVGGGWDAHGPYAVVQTRDQRIVRLLGIDPASGATSVLAEQRDEHWVQLLVGLPARTASGAVLDHLDADGTRYLTVAGKPVTPTGVLLRAVLGVEGERVLFTASEEPTQTQLWSYEPDTGARRLTQAPAVHTGVRRGDTLVLATRDRGLPGGQVVVLRGGERVGAIESAIETPAIELKVTDLVLGQRELRATLHLPSWHRPGTRLPVLLDPYGGASAQRVVAEVEWRALVAQWFAEQGFAVLVADGRGTPGRGPEWERAVFGDLFGPGIEDQVTALHEAARANPDLDLDRVGIRGWSFGGSLALAALLRRPDVFHVAVAGAGVTDQQRYNTHWRERFLGQVKEFPEHYEADSLVRAAPSLRRPLLLMHGVLDTNVHVTHALLMSAALGAADREHELALLPGVGHAAIGAPGTGELLSRQVRFLQRHLGVDPAGLPAQE